MVVVFSGIWPTVNRISTGSFFTQPKRSSDHPADMAGFPSQIFLPPISIIFE